MPFDPHDPRLTAYVLGELSAPDVAAVEALLQESADARQVVADLQQTASDLFAALQQEATSLEVATVPGLRQQLAAAGPSRVPKVARPVDAPHRPRLSPAIAFGATVASLAIVTGLMLLSNGGSKRSTAHGIDLASGPQLVFQLPQDGLTVDLSGGQKPEQLHATIEGTSKELAERVDLFNRLMGENRYTEAYVVAIDAKQLEPGHPAVVQMEVLSRFANNASRGTADNDNLSALHDVEQSVAANAGSMAIVTNRSELNPRRLQSAQAATAPTPESLYGNLNVEFESVNRIDLRTKLAVQNPSGQPKGYLSVNHFIFLDDFIELSTGGQSADFGVAVDDRYILDGTPLDEQVPLAWRQADLSWEDGAWDWEQSKLPRSESEKLAESELAEGLVLKQRLVRRPQFFSYYALRSPDVFFGRQATGYVREEHRNQMPRSSGEAYAPVIENDFAKPVDQTYSTFSIDVDTASYANVRRYLQDGQLPPANAVRLEELINAFDYDMPEPDGDNLFDVAFHSMPCPWQTEHQLVQFTLHSRDIPRETRPACSLVFLIDVSGSMQDDNKLPLAQQAMQLLTAEMREDDQIAIVTYSDEARVALPCTNGSQRETISAAISALHAEGSTNGEGGLNLAYETARKHFIKEGVNRVLLCTDGDFNVGTSDDAGIFKVIEEQRKDGVFLSVLGFGTGNLKDSKLEGLADKGNGHYSYIDNLREARKVLVEELTSTLYTLARDVKLQVEFNPDKVVKYRLLGYENRTLAAADFNNDKVDAGELGAGHRVTALYEIVPTGANTPLGAVDPPRYGPMTRRQAEVEAARERVREELPHDEEVAAVKVRYKVDGDDESRLVQNWYTNPTAADAGNIDQRFAAALAEFGLLLRNSRFKGQANWDQLVTLTRESLGDDPKGRRTEFLDLVLRARALMQGQTPESPQPTPPQQLLGSSESREKATCEKKYTDLLDKWEASDDFKAYGDFFDLGYRNSASHGSRQGLPAGYWVYVYPNWYIWGQRAMQ